MFLVCYWKSVHLESVEFVFSSGCCIDWQHLWAASSYKAGLGYLFVINVLRPGSVL